MLYLEYQILKFTEKSEIDVLLIFESLASESIKLRQSLLMAEQIYGKEYAKSTIVIMTKPDIFSEKIVETRRNQIINICSDLELESMVWQNMYDLPE